MQISDDLLLRETRIHFPRFDAGEVRITPIEKGGSDRKFYRIRCGAGSPAAGSQSIILVKYNLEREENRHYVRIAEFLGHHHIRAPKIYFHDEGEGLIWIEDLGEEDLFGHRNESWIVRRSFYESALDEVAKLHRLGADEDAEIKPSLPAEFNAALYHWEQGYFFENCLGRFYRLDPSELASLERLGPLNEIAQRLDARPRCLVHRDFQSQNIIVRNGNAYLIDFQGMRPGLPQYDLASLLYDPYVDLNEAEREELLEHYCAGHVTEDFRETMRFCAMQRLMQALGAYGYLGLVRGHPHFLTHIPKAMRSLGKVLELIEGLEPLRNRIAALAG